MQVRLALSLLALTGSGCGIAAPPPPPVSVTALGVSEPARAEAGPDRAVQPCSAEPRAIGKIQDVQLNEISGVVESRATPGVFFVHNDSGDSPRFFAIDRIGYVLAELALETVPLIIDAEDIAIGPAPGGKSFVYLGDTGNNFASMGLGIPRRKAVLYRVAEPLVPLSARALKVAIRDVLPIVLTFPHGARDVEAFFVDPVGGDLFLISKQSDGHSQLLSASAGLLEGGGGKLTLERELVFGKPPLPGSTMPTSASITRDGSAILVRSYSSVFLFRRQTGESVASALGRAPRELPAPPEGQGEAIGFADGDTAFITIPEGVKPAIACAKLPDD